MLAIKQNEKKDDSVLLYIYNHYRNDMYRAAMAIVHERQRAEAVVQEAFKRIIKHDHLVKKVHHTALGSYVVLIAKSIASNPFIFDASNTLADDKMFSDAIDEFRIDEIVIQKETLETITSALRRIGIHYAAPMIFRYYFNFSDGETADLLDIHSSATVRSICSQGKRMILDDIKKAGKLDERYQ